MQVEIAAAWSTDELVDALRQMESAEGRGLSVEELSQRLGRSSEWVRNRLRTLRDQGRLVVQWKSAVGIDGRMIRVPVYSLKKEQQHA